MSLIGKSVALVGYGKSNRALHTYLSGMGISPTIRNREYVSVPDTERLIVEGYLEADEDVVFRSPGIRPDKIKAKGKVTTESAYALSIAKGRKIGISGSDGKTTSATLIHKILVEDNRDSYLCGNIGTPIIEYANNLNDDSYLVCELSSFQLMDMRPSLDVALITNITENHLDWHRDMDEYIGAKLGMLEHAKRRVLNYDCDTLRPLSSEDTVFFSKEKPQKIPSYCRAVYRHGGAIYCDGEKIIDISSIRLKGDFNISNVQGAIGALVGSVDNVAIRRAVESFYGVSSRLSCIDTVGGVTFIDSSIDSTPSRTLATLSALDITKCAVILGGYDKNLCYAPLREALAGAKGAVLIGENSGKIFSEISGICKIYSHATLDEAVKRAYSLCSEGDSVVLSPASASFDMFDSYVDRAEKFKEIVRGLK